MHSVDELLAVVVRERDDDTRWTAVQQLHAIGTREVFDRALQLCGSSIAEERVAGADVVAQLTWKEDAARALMTMLGDSESCVTTAAVHALGHQLNARTIEAISLVAQHDDSNVRWAVAMALENGIADERAERVLLTLMRDHDQAVRDRATFAVGSLSDHDTPRIRAALAERLHDEDRAVSHEAALGLARRRDERAIPYIASALESDDSEIEEAAEEITSPDMLAKLLKARDAAGNAMGLTTLIARCRERSSA